MLCACAPHHAAITTPGSRMKDLLTHSFFAKVLLLLALTFLASIGLSQIGGLVTERGNSREAARQGLAAAYAGQQTLAGPFIVVPYIERWTDEKRDEDGKLKSSTARSRTGA